MAKDPQVTAFEEEIKNLDENFTPEAADKILKKIELQMKLEELNDKKRELKYGKFIRFSPVAVPIVAALLAFTGSMAANGLQTFNQINAPRSALIQKAVETTDQKQAAERLLFLHAAGLISLEKERKEYLQQVVSK